MDEYLVIQAARFGDLVQTKRLILSLLREGHVHLLLDRGLLALAERLYPSCQMHCLNFHAQSFDATGLEKTLAELTHIPFKRVFNCNCSGLSTSICRLFEREQIAGYRPTAKGQGIERSRLLRIITRLTRKRFQAAFNLVDMWGHLLADPISPWDVNPVAHGQGRGLGIVLAGRQSRRSIPPELMAEIIRVQVVQYNVHAIFFFGTAQEKKVSHLLRRALPGNLQSMICDLCGKTNFADLIQALQGLDLVLTPDTGTMHLCAHLGVPVQAFFLSSAFCHETGPYGPGHSIWQVQTPCAPCLESADCSHQLACLQALQSHTFLRAVSLAAKGVPDHLPEHICFLTTDCDRLGGIARLVAGNDPWQAERRYIRQCLQSLILGDGHSLCPPNFQQHAAIDALLIDDSDWMLPPERFA